MYTQGIFYSKTSTINLQCQAIPFVAWDYDLNEILTKLSVIQFRLITILFPIQLMEILKMQLPGKSL